jgi:hypothetical protein
MDVKDLAFRAACIVGALAMCFVAVVYIAPPLEDSGEDVSMINVFELSFGEIWARFFDCVRLVVALMIIGLALGVAYAGAIKGAL